MKFIILMIERYRTVVNIRKDPMLTNFGQNNSKFHIFKITQNLFNFYEFKQKARRNASNDVKR